MVNLEADHLITAAKHTVNAQPFMGNLHNTLHERTKKKLANSRQREKELEARIAELERLVGGRKRRKSTKKRKSTKRRRTKRRRTTRRRIKRRRTTKRRKSTRRRN